VEFYFVAFKKRGPFEIVKEFYSKFGGYDISNLQSKFYIKKNRHAADHQFRVAAGIDSMVLGENQIVGQLKEAYSSTCAVRTTGKVIHRLFHQAFRVGKLVRTDTEMGKGSCSISSAAVGLLKSKIGDIDKPNLLFIGINQMISLAASNLIKDNHGNLIFANRTEQKAVAFAEKFGGAGYGLARLEEFLDQSDVIITCTGSTKPIIPNNLLNKYFANNPDKTLIIIDMAIPRDVESEKNAYPNITIMDLEDIREYVNTQQAKREKAIPQAEEIIERKLDEFSYWFKQVRQEPIYNGLGDAFNDIYQQELGILFENLEPDMRTRLEKAGKKMLKKLLTLKLNDNTDN
jgi:glutamyl-tRNA reductase